MDVLTKEQRSYNMSSIRGKNTRPELMLRKRMFAAGLRYRLDYRIGRYRADIAFPTKKVAIMVDGCFWHCCPKCFRMPRSNVGYWRKKFRENRARDRRAGRMLVKNGWKLMRFWEHFIKERPNDVIAAVVRLREKRNV